MAFDAFQNQFLELSVGFRVNSWQGIQRLVLRIVEIARVVNFLVQQRVLEQEGCGYIVLISFSRERTKQALLAFMVVTGNLSWSGLGAALTLGFDRRSAWLVARLGEHVVVVGVLLVEVLVLSEGDLQVLVEIL